MTKLRKILIPVLLILIFKVCAALEPSNARLITISEGISLVLKDNRLVKVSLLDKDIASANSFLARSALMPQVTASVVQSYLNHQPGSKFGTQTINTGNRQSISYGFNVYQTLFDFGKVLSAYKASAQLIGGGLTGILLGSLISYLITLLAGWAARVSWSSIFLATTFSLAVGTIFGLWPARKASKLDPIEALRYE